MQEDKTILDNVDGRNVDSGTEGTEAAKVEEIVPPKSDLDEKSDKSKAQSQKRTRTPRKKEVKVMTPFEESADVLYKVCNKFPDCTISKTKTGVRIKRGSDIIAAANLHECKITIPVEGSGLKVWHDNKHMTRIPHGHKDLAKLLTRRCKDKRTNREAIDTVYGKGAVTPGHARLTTPVTAEELDAKAKELKKQATALRKAERKKATAQRATKGKKVASATA